MSQGRFFRRIVDLRTRLDSTPELPFSEFLTAERIRATLDELGVVYRERIYSPCVTLWIFLSQVLSADHSCRDAVARFLAFRTARGESACSTETGSYCEARQRLPEELLLRLAREVRVRVTVAGFRAKSLVVVTTLTDPQQFSAVEMANLFRQRWQAELDLRSIKSVMQMDVLRCKSPDMVRKEMWAHLLAYNLLRSVMCAAAEEHDLPVREVSFKGALQILNAFYHGIITSDPQLLEAICTRLLLAVHQHRVGNRPDRYEPRKRKRAVKPYPAMKGHS